MELQVWSGDFGLPTWHPGCLALWSYCRFTGAPVTVRATDAPLLSGAWRLGGDLPAFSHPQRLDLPLGDFESLVSHLERECRFSTEAALTPRQRAEGVAFRRMVEERLAPASAFVAWVEPVNHAEITRPWFARRLGFPSAFAHPPRYRRAAAALVEAAARCDPELEPELAERAVASLADDCLGALSQKLGDKQYFFGTQPSALDALAFSHLAPILRVPWPAAGAIVQSVKKYPNLERFVSRILNSYFAKECAANADRSKKKEAEGKEEDGDDKKKKKAKTPAELREERWILFENTVCCVGAVSLMLLYGYGTGIFHRMNRGLQQLAAT